MKWFRIGITWSGLGKSKLSADSSLIAGRVTGAAGLMRPYGDLHRNHPSSTPTSGSGACYIFESPVVT